MSKKLAVQMNGHSDEFGTPPIAFELLMPYIDIKKTIWECAYGAGCLAKIMAGMKYKVITSNNFFLDCPEYDIIVTNPPYSLKYEFLERAYSLGKPFAFLMPLTALEGQKRQKLYNQYGIQLIIPNKRINFITSSGQGSGAWFMTAWFCWQFYLPKELNFVQL